MTQKERALRQGSDSAKEIYLSVGVALSWWESSEDIIMGVFRDLCGKDEPVAFETYVKSNRATRTRMLRTALEKYPGRFTKEETVLILRALVKLDKLAKKRNQIAHGHVSKQTSRRDGVIEMQGNFLVPSFNESGDRLMRDQRYALTAAEIDEWRDLVRAERASIIDIQVAAIKRKRQANDPA